MASTVMGLTLAANLWICGNFLLWGGPCGYIDTSGTATIASVVAGDPNDLNCSNDPVVVTFDFEPDDPNNAKLAVNGVQLRISEGVNPPREWVESEGLAVGSQHDCVRRDITTGTCTPLLFEFPKVAYETGIELCYERTTFAMTAFPVVVEDAIYEQRIVLLVRVEDYGFVPALEPVHVTATDRRRQADITIEPEYIFPGQVSEVTVIPQAPPTNISRISSLRTKDSPYGKGQELIVKLCGSRDDFQQCRDVSINILPGEDWSLEYASAVRDRFIPYLAESYHELGITTDTLWTGTIVKPHILVVTHYLFFSEEWEMGVMWHVMIPPYDWARIYLRHRYTDFEPQYAFEISSLSADPPETPFPIDPPPQVDR